MDVTDSRAMSDSIRTQRLVAADLRHVWHPFTQQQGWPTDDPLVIESADGIYLTATDGRRYLDGVSSLWTSVHCHRVPEIDDAVRRQLDTGRDAALDIAAQPHWQSSGRHIVGQCGEGGQPHQCMT